jgi:CTD kinase subunit beta
MLDPERARDEKNLVAEYFKVEEEEYEVEVERERKKI